MSSIERPAMVAAAKCSTANMLFAAYICSRVGQILPIIVARKNSRLSPLHSTGIRPKCFSSSVRIDWSAPIGRKFRRPIGRPAPRLAPPITETLEVIPRQWKVIQHVREKFTCRDCEKISQAPAPFHVIARGWADPSLLAMILFEKYGQHQPLNRQSERYAREGVPLSLSTLADQVGGCCAVLAPLLRRIEAHVFAAERLHGDA